MVDGLCRGLLRNRAEAEDASQQTFLSAYRALLAGTEPREPVGWLATIARHESLARIRARMREPLPVDELEAESTAPDPLAEALRRADLTAFWAAVSALPRPQRDALLLREFGGLTYEQLAVALGVSRPAVESLLFRARTRLRAQLQTAVASLGGAGWLSAAQDALARLLSTGGAAKIGSVPVVAKAVTATVGIALVAGGAVVAERPTAQHRHVDRAPAAVVRVAAVRPALPTLDPSAGHQFEPPAAAATSHETRTDGGSSGGDGNDRSDAEAARRPAHEGGDGEQRRSASEQARRQPGDGSGDEARSRSDEGGDSSGGDSGSGGGEDGSSPVFAIATPVVEAATHDAGLAAAGD